MALTWGEEGQPWEGLVWFDPCHGRGRPASGRSGLVWFGAHLGIGRPARRTYSYGLLWRLPGKREASHGVGLVWSGAYQGRGKSISSGLVWHSHGRGRPATRRSGLVWHLPWTHNGGGTHEKGLPGGATEEERGQPGKGLVWFGPCLG